MMLERRVLLDNEAMLVKEYQLTLKKVSFLEIISSSRPSLPFSSIPSKQI